MATEKMKVTSHQFIAGNPNIVRLFSDNQNPDLATMTVVKDTNGAPPDPDKASGNYSSQTGTAGVTAGFSASVSNNTWNNLMTRINGLPTNKFMAALIFSGTSVTDLNFENAA